MDARFTLPPELVAGASINGNEYGWPPGLFPDAARRAEPLGYACLGGQFQFRAPAGTCEMYWLSADAADRQPGEDWRAYCERSRTEVWKNSSRLWSELTSCGKPSNGHT